MSVTVLRRALTFGVAGSASTMTSCVPPPGRATVIIMRMAAASHES